MNDDLMRRISDAMDAPGGLDADAELRERLGDDAVASTYAEDLSAIDEALGQLGGLADERDWDAFADGIETRLGEPLDDIGDVTAAPSLVDEEPAIFEPAPEIAPEAAAAAPAPVVDLASRRRRRTILTSFGGLAAAAAVGLGIIFGMSFQSGDEEAVSAVATLEPAMQEAAPSAVEEMLGEVEATAEAEPEAWAEGMQPGSPPAEEPADLSAAAAAAPMARRSAGGRSAMPPAPAAVSPTATPTPFGVGGMGAGTGRGGGGGSRGMLDEDQARTDQATLRPRALAVLASASTTAAVQRCMGDGESVARVRVRVGSDGRTAQTLISPPYDTGEAAACIRRVLGGLSLPTSGAPYLVTHTYSTQRAAGGSMGSRSGPAARQRARRARPASRAPARPSSEALDAWE